METQKTLNRHNNLEKNKNKKTQTGGVLLCDFRVYYIATVIKTVMALAQTRHIDK